MREGRLERLFLFACSVSDQADWDAWRGDVALSAAQWTEIARLADAHGFVGLLARNLAWLQHRHGIAIPVVEPLEAHRRGQLVQHLARKAAARRVGESLREAAIPFIVFKGVVLAEEVYGDLSLRGFRDFDVMVPRDRLREAWDLLRALGYRSPQPGSLDDWVRYGAHAVGMSHADGSGVDLHWSIAPDIRDARRIESLWKHATSPAPGSHLPGLRLSPEMTLAHLAKHFHSHQYSSVKALVDFHVAARKRAAIDPETLVAAARELDLLPIVEIAAALSERVFVPGSTPGLLGARARGMQARLAPAVLDERFLVRSGEQARITNWLRYLLVAGSLAETFRNLYMFLVPGRLLLMQFFGRPFEARMYPVYYWRQFRKVVTLSNK